jgi:hypothetical protein
LSNKIEHIRALYELYRIVKKINKYKNDIFLMKKISKSKKHMCQQAILLKEGLKTFKILFEMVETLKYILRYFDIK